MGLVAFARPTARAALRVADLVGNFAVGAGTPVRDGEDDLQHLYLEGAQQGPVDRQVERPFVRLAGIRPVVDARRLFFRDQAGWGA